jgi:phosphoglycolate phosphatase
MKRYTHILFDLDGTLTDPALGITNSVMYALRRYGIEVTDARELYCFIGPPLAESFQVYYGFSVEESVKAVEVYREYFADKGLYENTVYDGMESLLARLKEQGHTLMVATSKPEVFARRILHHFGLDIYFDVIAGSNLDGTRVDKAEVIAEAMERAGLTDPSCAVMVGDRRHDVIGAHKNHMDSIGVLFGYGDREELESAGATYVAADVAELGARLCENL